MRDCKECGEEIPEARLKALPHAETCVHCQQNLESNGKFARHVMDVRATMKAGEIDEVHSTIVRGPYKRQELVQ